MATVVAVVGGLVLLGGALILGAWAVGLLRFEPRPEELGPEEEWMLVVAPNSWGIPRLELKRTAVPDRVERGMERLDEYVERLAQSHPPCSLMIFHPDGQRGLGLMRRGGTTELLVSVKDPAREAAVRRLFGSSGISPTQDYRTLGGVRCLVYPVGEGQAVTNFCHRCLREVYGLDETDPLQFAVEE